MSGSNHKQLIERRKKMNEKPKYQINFKLSSGDLINLYADNADELAEQLSYIQGLAAQITTVSKTLNSASAHPAGMVVHCYFPIN